MTRDEAGAWIARELARDADAFDPTQPLDDYLTYWMRLQGAEWSPQTRIRYKYEARAIGTTGAIPLTRLRGDHIASAKVAMLGRGVTRRYVYNVLSLIRRALADAVKWKIISENVAESVSLPDPEKKVTQAWDLDEIQAVLKAIVGHRFEAIYLLILWGGLRIGEVVGLRWDQIHEDGMVAFSQAEWTQVRGRPLGATKREHDRETQIPAVVLTRLKELRARGPSPVKGRKPPANGVAFVYVAQRHDGNRWTPHTIREDWRSLVAGAHLGDDGERVKSLLPHGGRRSFGTAHMVSGTPLADLASLMGHNSPATTAASYLGSSRGRRREAAERLASLLLPADGPNEGQIRGQ